MPQERRMPGPAERNNERILERGYDSFAALPEEEVASIDRPGGGPHGSVDDGPRMPLLTIAVGAALVFATFFFDNLWPLVIGLAVVIAGGIWSGVERSRLDARATPRRM
jgi:hypothetical protein